MRNLILISVIVPMLAACAGTKPPTLGEYKKDNSKSEAMNVAIAVGLTDPQNGPLHDAAPMDREGHGAAINSLSSVNVPSLYSFQC